MMWLHHIPVFPKLIYYCIRFFWSLSIPHTCKIGKNTKLAYGGIGVVIHARAVIGENCVIGQGVTIGGKSGWYEVPVIGNNVEINAGSRILGPVIIGDNVIIGANAVVIKDIPSNCVVAGVPAQIIKANMNEEDFENMKRSKTRGNSSFPITPYAKK